MLQMKIFTPCHIYSCFKLNNIFANFHLYYSPYEIEFYNNLILKITSLPLVGSPWSSTFQYTMAEVEGNAVFGTV